MADRTLQEEITAVINRYAREAGSGTPDFILGEYLLGALKLFDETTNKRDQWWGFDPHIGGIIPAKGVL